MRKKIEIATWNRKEHFEFFSAMEEPFFGISLQIDCTKAYQNAKNLNIPFFVYYLHKTLMAVNVIDNFKYRICDGDVFQYDTIHASATILRNDTTFGFSLIEFTPDIVAFNAIAQKEITRIQNTSGLFTRDFPENNLIHFSAIPWINFTATSHARGFSYPDSCPKISFGKLTSVHESMFMPMSIHVHHGLMDGYHVGLFVEAFEKQMNS